MHYVQLQDECKNVNITYIKNKIMMKNSPPDTKFRNYMPNATNFRKKTKIQSLNYIPLTIQLNISKKMRHKQRRCSK